MKTFAAVESQDVHLCTQHQISKLRAVKLPNATFFLKKEEILQHYLCFFPKAAFYPYCLSISLISLVRETPQLVLE